MYAKKYLFIASIALVLFATTSAAPAAETAKKIQAGIIGLDTSHCVAFTNIFHNPKAAGELAEVKIVAAYPGGSPDMPKLSMGRVKGFTEKMKGMGVEIVDSIDELLKRCDVVFLESVDGRVHLEQATKVINAGKPLFIDKPMADTTASAAKIFRLAKEKNVPCFSASSLRYGSLIQAIRNGTADIGDVRGCTAWSTASLDPNVEPYWFHGIHGVEILFTAMGKGCKTVTCASREKAIGAWADGRQGVFTAKKGYGASIEGSKKTGNADKFEGYAPLLVEVVKFFKTGKSPIDPQETLEILAFMEAADQSLAQKGAPVSIESILKKAEE